MEAKPYKHNRINKTEEEHQEMSNMASELHSNLAPMPELDLDQIETSVLQMHQENGLDGESQLQ